LFVISLRRKSLINLKPNGDNWAWPVLQDTKGNIWFTNWIGAYRYDGKSFTTFTKNNGLCNDAVTRIIEDKKGNLWFGGNGGLFRYDGKSFTGLRQEMD
jgi:streptogramin lyase